MRADADFLWRFFCADPRRTDLRVVSIGWERLILWRYAHFGSFRPDVDLLDIVLTGSLLFPVYFHSVIVFFPFLIMLTILSSLKFHLL
jgi:hypothetical protein